MRKLVARKSENSKCKKQLQYPDFRNRHSGPQFSCREDKDYGGRSQQPDIDEAMYVAKKAEFLSALEVTPKIQRRLQDDTKGQAASPVWHQERRKRISATKVHSACRPHRKRFKFQNLVKQMLYPTCRKTKAMEYGSKKGHEAKEAYKLLHPDDRVSECGMFVDLDCPYLCASPDRLVNDNRLLEVKWPYAAQNYSTLRETARHHNISVKVDNKDCLYLPKTHSYYYQVQTQLHVTQKSSCGFMVWSPNDVFSQRIEIDDGFWKNCARKLEVFYSGYLLPELLDPRMTRDMDLKTEPVKQVDTSL